jgi:hypothetical protein
MLCRELQELFPAGIGIHHAGMLRGDRNLMERAFAAGLLKARGLCCFWLREMIAHQMTLLCSVLVVLHLPSLR